MERGSFCYVKGTPVLEGRALTKFYTLGKERVRALDRVDFTALQGDFTVVSGPSGSGKSTLLNLLALIDRPSEGRCSSTGSPRPPSPSGPWPSSGGRRSGLCSRPST